MRPAAEVGDGFDTFARTHGDRLRCLLVARYGVEVGNEVCADALAYAWEHWDDVREMTKPVGLLYRVAQSSSRRHFRWRRAVRLPPEQPVTSPEPQLELGRALTRLSEGQRVSVVLVHAFGWTYDEVAEALDVPTSTVRNHVHRGVVRLRDQLEQ
jgi:RNA polymerase sigma-70 factor (ECF subfamily)